MDIWTLGIYYFIIAISFSISTFITYVRPSITIARHIADEDHNVLGTNIVNFTLEYLFLSTLSFPIQLYQILTTDPEFYQDKIIEVLLTK